MTNALTGFLRGTTITLDAPVPTLDGRRVRVVVEPVALEHVAEDRELSPAENTALLREWALRGPQGPIDEDGDFPDDP